MTESDISTFYPHLREVVDERFANLTDEELEHLFSEALGEGVTPAEYEEFFAGLGKAVTKITPVLEPIGRDVLKGATAGSVAGPWGALAGGVLGGAGSALKRHGRGRTRKIGNAMGSVVGAAGALGGRGATVKGVSGVLGALGQGGTGKPAINALRGILGRPETGAALRALVAGTNPAIAVGRTQTPVPASAFAGLLGALAQEAEVEAESDFEWGEALTMPTYLLDMEGQPVVNPTVPEERAARLLQLLAGASLETENEDIEAWDDLDEWEEIEAESPWGDLDDGEDLIDAEDLLDATDPLGDW